MADIYLSVIIPAYNEEKRIGQTLDRVTSFLKSQPYPSEIIVVDDGSQDQTAALAAERLSGFVHHQVIKNPANRGKGAVVKQGMMEGKGKFLLFSDADLSTPIEETTRFLRALEEGYDVVIGSRSLSESNVEIRQNIMRQTMGKIFNLFARLLTFKSIHDSQCGFKGFKKEAGRDLFGKQKIPGFSFDVEIIYLAQKGKYRILEMPVTWRNSPQSRVRIAEDSFNMFLDLLRIRWLHRKSDKG